MSYTIKYLTKKLRKNKKNDTIREKKYKNTLKKKKSCRRNKKTIKGGLYKKISKNSRKKIGKKSNQKIKKSRNKHIGGYPDDKGVIKAEVVPEGVVDGAIEAEIEYEDVANDCSVTKKQDSCKTEGGPGGECFKDGKKVKKPAMYGTNKGDTCRIKKAGGVEQDNVEQEGEEDTGNEKERDKNESQRDEKDTVTEKGGDKNTSQGDEGDTGSEKEGDKNESQRDEKDTGTEKGGDKNTSQGNEGDTGSEKEGDKNGSQGDGQDNGSEKDGNNGGEDDVTSKEAVAVSASNPPKSSLIDIPKGFVVGFSENYGPEVEKIKIKFGQKLDQLAAIIKDMKSKSEDWNTPQNEENIRILKENTLKQLDNVGIPVASKVAQLAGTSAGTALQVSGVLQIVSTMKLAISLVDTVIELMNKLGVTEKLAPLVQATLGKAIDAINSLNFGTSDDKNQEFEVETGEVETKTVEEQTIGVTNTDTGEGRDITVEENKKDGKKTFSLGSIKNKFSRKQKD